MRSDIISRRIFFKKASSKLIPILSCSFILSSVLSCTKDEFEEFDKDEPMGCENNCLNSCAGCKGTCTWTCREGCAYSCLRNCADDCYVQCVSSCKGTCSSHCIGSCKSGCYLSNKY